MAENTTNAAETEGSPTEGAGDTAAAGNKKKKILMLVSAGVAVVGVVLAVGIFFFMGGKEEADPHAEAKATPIPDIVTYDVPPFTINLLQEEGAGARFLKITLSLELKNAADSDSMAKVLPRLQDDWGGYMRQLRGTDLQGSAAMQRLREGLLRRAVQTLDPIPVTGVYIRDMIVQ
ncbi:MAG: flagellar basal body-associated FliL family protein [Pseudomonadota bacterium]|jgi:flagellar FliL protein